MLSLLHAATLLVLSQTPATIAGVIQDDATGEPLAGAVIALPELHRAVPSDSSGRYALHGIAAGRYMLDVRALGYARRALEVLVPAGGVIEVNVAMPSVPIRVRGVEVSTRRRLALGVGREPALRSRAASTLAHDPFLSEPDALRALEGGAIAARPESPSGLHVNGGAADQTAY